MKPTTILLLLGAALATDVHAALFADVKPAAALYADLQPAAELDQSPLKLPEPVMPKLVPADLPVVKATPNLPAAQPAAGSAVVVVSDDADSADENIAVAIRKPTMTTLADDLLLPTNQHWPAMYARLSELAYTEFSKIDWTKMELWQKDAHRLTVALSANLKDKKKREKADPTAVVNQLIDAFEDSEDDETGASLQAILKRIARQTKHGQFGIEYNPWTDIQEFLYTQNKKFHEVAFMKELNDLIKHEAVRRYHGYEAHMVFWRNGDELSGYTLFNRETNHIVVVFKGSVSFSDWLTNAKAWHTGSGAGDAAQGLEVHSGIAKFANEAIAKSRRALREYLTDANNVEAMVEAAKNGHRLRVTFTGHSLGAAIASLATYNAKHVIIRDLQSLFSYEGQKNEAAAQVVANSRVDCFAFSSPRILSKESAQFFENVVGKRNVARIHFTSDPVTTVPFKLGTGISSLMGTDYKHIGLNYRLKDRGLSDRLMVVKEIFAAVANNFSGTTVLQGPHNISKLQWDLEHRLVKGRQKSLSQHWLQKSLFKHVPVPDDCPYTSEERGVGCWLSREERDEDKAQKDAKRRWDNNEPASYSVGQQVQVHWPKGDYWGQGEVVGDKYSQDQILKKNKMEVRYKGPTGAEHTLTITMENKDQVRRVEGDEDYNARTPQEAIDAKQREKNGKKGFFKRVFGSKDKTAAGA